MSLSNSLTTCKEVKDAMSSLTGIFLLCVSASFGTFPTLIMKSDFQQ